MVKHTGAVHVARDVRRQQLAQAYVRVFGLEVECIIVSRGIAQLCRRLQTAKGGPPNAIFEERARGLGGAGAEAAQLKRLDRRYVGAFGHPSAAEAIEEADE